MIPNVTDLTSQQYQAIDLYLAGKSTSNIAETLGIHRQTLWRWRQLPEFQRVYADLRAEHHEELRTLMRETVSLALQALHAEMQKLKKDSFGRLDDAIKVLKAFNIGLPLAGDEHHAG